MSVLKIHLTCQCSAVCDHRRFACAPAKAAVIDNLMALETAKALQSLNGLETVVILGGEPGPLAERTPALATSLRALRMQVRLETNACWATDDGRAGEYLAPPLMRESR